MATVELRSMKAHPIPGELMPDLRITFSDQSRKMYRTEDSDPYLRCQQRYQEEADQLVDALEKHLPGGLVDALFASLCARKASCLRVPNIDRSKGDPE